MPNEPIAPFKRINRRLKVGLLVDTPLVSQYVYELAKWARANDSLTLSHLIICAAEGTRHRTGQNVSSPFHKNGFLNSIRLASFALIATVEQFRMRGNANYKDHLTLANVKEVVPEAITITPIATKGGLVFEFSAADIRTVRDLDLDILIQCGSRVVSGGIVTSSRFGVISIFHCDERVNRGGPAGFWEVYFKQDNTGFTIRQLSEGLEGGNVLVRGCFRTRSHFLLNQAALYTKSAFYLKKLLSDIAFARALPPLIEPQPYFNQLLREPSLTEQLKYISCCAFRKALNAISRTLLKKNYRFGVAYMNSDWKALVMGRASKICNPPNHFLADPFVITEGNRAYCFVEDYDYKTSKGCICVYELKEGSAERLGEAVVERFHMSFPYLFRFGSTLYMCPETSENRDIRLYECVKFPLQWKLSKIVMSNLSAVDTMMFEHDGLWWLFTNIDPTNTGSHESELFIFYSDSPLGDKWHSHSRNPVLIDSAKGRNGGIVFDDKWIYRVSQRQGYNLYGKGLSVNKITVLSKDEYVETELFSVEPKFFPRLAGCHHLHSSGNISAFDYLALDKTR